jgi:Xaa-Pro aminopeptidase
VIGYDPNTYPASPSETRKAYFHKLGMEFRAVPTNLCNEVWTDQPAYPLDPIKEHTIEWAGMSMQDKITTTLEKCTADHLLVVLLDEIAWVLNLRGADIEYNPVFFSYLVITKESRKISLFINAEKLGEVGEYLASNGVEVHPYEAIGSFIAGLDGTVQVPASECNAALYANIKNPVDEATPIEKLKMVKSEREVRGMTEC